MKKLFITGSGGFLGTHICNEFRRSAPDDYQLLTPRSSEVNLLDYQQLSNYLAQEKPDLVLHAAGKCGGIGYNDQQELAYPNILMGLNIFEAARLNGIKTIHSLGSVCGYPSEAPIPFKEEDIWEGAPHFSNESYGHAKRTLLMLSKSYRKHYGFRGSHLVPINLYGPGDNFDLQNAHVAPSIIRKVYEAKRDGKAFIECFGNGEATRELFFVEDCAKAIFLAVSKDLDEEVPINLGTGKNIKIKDLVEKIVYLMDAKHLEIKWLNDNMDGQKDRRLFLDRMHDVIGYMARIELDEGLMKTIEYYQSNINDDLASKK